MRPFSVITKDCALQIEEAVELPYEMFAESLSQGTGTFTTIAGFAMNPKESAMGEPTKFVVKQGSTQDTAIVCVLVKEPKVTNRSTFH